MARRRLRGPVGGVANNTASVDTPAQFAPPGSMLNVNLVGPTTQRPRLGRRPGTRKLFTQQMAGGLSRVQCLATVDVASGVSGYQRQACARWSAFSNRELGAIAGHLWLLEPNTAMYGAIKDVATQTAGDQHWGIYCCCWRPLANNEWAVIFSGLAKKASNNALYTCVYCYHAGTKALLWRTFLDDRDTPAGTPGTVDIIANSVRLSAAQNTVHVAAGPYVYNLAADTGTFVARYTAGGWGDEMQDTLPDADGNVWGLFMGSAAVTGDVTSNTRREGWFYRAGVAKWNLSLAPNMTRVALTTGGEGNHGTLRLSSILRRQPRGMIPFGFAKLSGGDLVVVGTNRGWNADGTLPPDSSQAPSTVARFTQAGVNVWERDTYSRLDAHVVGAATYYNDIPSGIPGNNTPEGSYGPGGPEPSINAVAVDALDNIYVGGRIVPTTLGNRNVFAFTADGDLKWSASVGDFVHQHCIVIDPTDGHLWVGGKRNSSWTGSGGASAHLWKLSRDTGAVLASCDLNAAGKNVYGLAVNPLGQIAYVTEVI